MLTFDEILLHIKFQLKLFLFACSPPSYKELFNVKSLRVRMSMERQFMLRTSESFQLCAISINDTVNVHVLLSVKLSMFHSLQSIHSLFSSFFSLRLHISHLSIFSQHTFYRTLNNWVWKKAFNTEFRMYE